VVTINKFLLKFIESFIFVVFSAMVVIVFAQVIFRYVFEFSLSWGSEFSQYGMVWLCFLGAALATRDRDHTRVDFFINLLPRRFYPIVNVLVNLIIIAFILYLSYSSIPITKAFMKDITPGLGIPYGYVSLALPVGGLLMVIYLINDSIRWLRKGDEPFQ
jgi:TRAP-type C4-dicarboxylate transport system permease small subunit